YLSELGQRWLGYNLSASLSRDAILSFSEWLKAGHNVLAAARARDSTFDKTMGARLNLELASYSVKAFWRNYFKVQIPMRTSAGGQPQIVIGNHVFNATRKN